MSRIEQMLADAEALRKLVALGRTDTEPGVLTKDQANKQFRKTYGIPLYPKVSKKSASKKGLS